MTHATIFLARMGGLAQIPNPIYDILDLLTFGFWLCLGGGVVVVALGVVIASIKWWLNWQLEKQARLVEIEKARVEIAKVQMETQLVRAENGLFPVSLSALESPQWPTMALQSAAMYFDARRTYPNVPSNLTYSPQFSHKGMYTVDDSPTLSETSQSWEVPTFGQAFASGLMNNKILVGFTQEIQPVREEWLNIRSLAISGKSGSGKTNTARVLMAQAMMHGAQFVICDPHGHSEESLVAVLGTLRQGLYIEPAITEEEIINALNLVAATMEQRIDSGDKGSPILLVVDEFNRLMNRSAIAQQLQHVVEGVAQEGRKFNLFCIISGQNWSGQRTGGDAGLRDSLLAAIVHRNEERQARMLLPNEEINGVHQFKPGQGVFMDATGECTLIQVPVCSDADIELAMEYTALPLEIPSTQASTNPSTTASTQHPASATNGTGMGTGNGTESITAKERQIIELYQTGASINELVRSTFGDVVGRPKANAIDEIPTAIRKAVRL